MRMQSSGSPDERHCCSRADETQMLAQAHETEFAFVADNSPSRNLVLPCPKASKVSKMVRPSRKAGATVSWPNPTSIVEHDSIAGPASKHGTPPPAPAGHAACTGSPLGHSSQPHCKRCVHRRREMQFHNVRIFWRIKRAPRSVDQDAVGTVSR